MDLKVTLNKQYKTTLNYLQILKKEKLKKQQICIKVWWLTLIYSTPDKKYRINLLQELSILVILNK